MSCFVLDQIFYFLSMKIFFNKIYFYASVLAITLVERNEQRQEDKDLLWQWCIFTYHYGIFQGNVRNSIILDIKKQQSS